MVLSLFWSKYVLELNQQPIGEPGKLYQYLLAQERWNWFLGKIPVPIQIALYRKHSGNNNDWNCDAWLKRMEEWFRENKHPEVYEAVMDRIGQMKNKSTEELELTAIQNVSDEELASLQAAGHFLHAKKLSH